MVQTSHLDRLHKALVAAFTRDELRQCVRLCMVDADFDHIAPEKGFYDQVYDFVQWAARQDRVEELAKCACEQRPRNEELKKLAGELAPPHALTLDWVAVPAGDFLMGSDPAKDADAGPDELPLHTVHLPEYHITRLPITVAQFRMFVDATGHMTTAEANGWVWRWSDEVRNYVRVYGASWQHPHGPNTHTLGKLNHPVTCISFPDALAFCRWAEVRLPTEAEWEKAARGTAGRIYPWGDEPPTAAHCLCGAVSDRFDTVPVGRYPLGASPYGALDMSGNVYEWTASLAFAYPYRPDDGREDLDDMTNRRVLRGGGFTSGSAAVRCAFRNTNSPTRVYAPYGFRVAALCTVS